MLSRPRSCLRSNLARRAYRASRIQMGSVRHPGPCSDLDIAWRLHRSPATSCRSPDGRTPNAGPTIRRPKFADPIEPMSQPCDGLRATEASTASVGWSSVEWSMRSDDLRHRDVALLIAEGEDPLRDLPALGQCDDQDHLRHLWALLRRSRPVGGRRSGSGFRRSETDTTSSYPFAETQRPPKQNKGCSRWALEESNLRPLPRQGSALPLS